MWKEPYSGYYEYTHNDITYARIMTGRVSLMISVRVGNPEKDIWVKDSLSFGGLFSFLSSRVRKYNHERYLKKAKEWCEQRICVEESA